MLDAVFKVDDHSNGIGSLKEMPSLIVVCRDGTEKTISAAPDRNLMEIMREGGVDEILALCGGTCSCCTCHVIVHPDDAGRLPPILENESALLEDSEHCTPTSRLACQVVFSEGLDGLRVTVAPED